MKWRNLINCPAVCSEPIRKHLQDFPDAQFIQAECSAVDFATQTIECTAEYSGHKSSRVNVSVDYDQLVVAVGAEPATFNIPGVREKCMFIKEIDDGMTFLTESLNVLITHLLTHCRDQHSEEDTEQSGAGQYSTRGGRSRQ
jgi:NADH dehydrogenase FAD-containing subunit